MIKSQNVGNESGYSNPFALAVAAIAICSSLALGAAALAPAAASNGSYTITGNGSTGYFPDQFVNQAREIEAMPDTDGNTGLAGSFPAEIVNNPAREIDSTPEMYS
jgi:hypothetical protein